MFFDFHPRAAQAAAGGRRGRQSEQTPATAETGCEARFIAVEESPFFATLSPHPTGPLDRANLAFG